MFRSSSSSTVRVTSPLEQLHCSCEPSCSRQFLSPSFVNVRCCCPIDQFKLRINTSCRTDGKLNDLCYSPSITVVIMVQRCTWQHVWAVHKCSQGFGEETGRRLLRRPEPRRRVIMGGSLLDTYGSRQGRVTGCCDHGDEPSVSINVKNV